MVPMLPEQEKRQFIPRATLVAIGIQLRRLRLLEPISQKVRIAQKTVKFSPAEKLTDALITILAGAHGLVEANKRVRPDPGLQQAFGRSGCAEQSVIQDTLDACTADNVQQMEEALALIYRQHSQGYRHPYEREWQLLEVDLTGRPCGPKAAFATPGYFSRQRNRRGRQVGYVMATRYGEVVVEQVFAGKEQLNAALRPLVEAAERVLELDEAKRRRSILRIDAGGGSVEQVNWLLERGYHLHGKDYSTKRAEKLAASVQEWFTDPEDPNREFGWVTLLTEGLYVRPVRRIAVRCRKKNGQWGVGVILSTLEPQEMLALVGESPEKVNAPQAVLGPTCASMISAAVEWRLKSKRTNTAWGLCAGTRSVWRRSKWSCCWKCWPTTFWYGRAAGWPPSVPGLRSGTSALDTGCDSCQRAAGDPFVHHR